MQKQRELSRGDLFFMPGHGDFCCIMLLELLEEKLRGQIWECQVFTQKSTYRIALTDKWFAENAVFVQGIQ